MNQKTRNIVGWSLTVLISLVVLMSAFMKLKGGDEVVKNSAMIGLTKTSLFVIGIVELLSIALFIVPRTGVLGTLLLAAYLGGAIVTHLEHADKFTVPLILQCLVWITAVIRFPELSKRLVGKPIDS